jgi:hypothetical protein
MFSHCWRTMCGQGLTIAQGISPFGQAKAKRINGCDLLSRRVFYWRSWTGSRLSLKGAGVLNPHAVRRE